MDAAVTSKMHAYVRHSGEDEDEDEDASVICRSKQRLGFDPTLVMRRANNLSNEGVGPDSGSQGQGE